MNPSGFAQDLNLQDIGVLQAAGTVYRNAVPHVLNRLAVESDGCSVASSGALLAYSGTKLDKPCSC